MGKKVVKSLVHVDAQEFLRQQPELILGNNWIGQIMNRLYAVERLKQFSKDRGKTPQEMLRLKIAVKDGEIDEAAILRK